MRAEKKASKEIILPEILYENESLLVVNKPPGWIVNTADTTSNQPVLQKWIEKSFLFPIFDWPEGRGGIVHRLDKETSGCIIVAKNKDAFLDLQEQFKDREVSKTYLALVHGKVRDNSGEITASVGRLPWRRDRFGVLQGGREASTSYVVEARLKNSLDAYTLIKLHPKTGRTHQIRIHMKYIGHPLVSDSFYAGRKTSRKDHNWCPRLFLHAQSISFLDPVTKQKISVKAPLPSDLTTALNYLQPLTSAVE